MYNGQYGGGGRGGKVIAMSLPLFWKDRGAHVHVICYYAWVQARLALRSFFIFYFFRFVFDPIISRPTKSGFVQFYYG